MSQMYQSSSHQLVAAAFRRARKKFPTNFGQLSWPIHYERRDSKSEKLQSATTCKKCEECLVSSEIRNVRSSNVWPQFTSFWTSDPRGTQSMRENSALPRRRKVSRTTCGRCDCGRICGARRRNAVVSFSEEGKSKGRCSGGDAAGERSSVETVSSKSCRSRVRHGDLGPIETFDATLLDDKEKKKLIEKKSKTSKHRSCIHENERSQNLEKVDLLNLLYDRGNDRTKNSVSFTSDGKEPDVDDSRGDEEAGHDFPSEIEHWENGTREDMLRSGSRSRVVVGDEIIVNCSCGKKNEQFCNENYRRHRHHSHQTRFERNQCRHDRDLLLRPEGSRASSTEETNRLCKDCARGRCSKNSSTVPSLIEDEDEEQQQQQCNGGRGDDVCAIKHKDSMTILVEKFKNKRNPNECSDEETSFKDDTEMPSCRMRNSEKKITRIHRDESDDTEIEGPTCCKCHGNNAATLDAEKFCKNLKSLESRSGYCCSMKNGSCRRDL